MVKASIYLLSTSRSSEDFKTRRSVAGLAVLYGGAAVAYKSKLEPVVATSSTEAEFIAAVICAKTVKYLRTILHDLGFSPKHPTCIYIDNLAALYMINESRPTPRAKHIDTQWFAIQEWAKNKDLIMKHISGILNMSDDLTKPLSWVLHERHSRRGMGHYGRSDPAPINQDP